MGAVMKQAQEYFKDELALEMAEVMNLIYLVLLYVWYNISTEIK